MASATTTTQLTVLTEDSRRNELRDMSGKKDNFHVGSSKVGQLSRQAAFLHLAFYSLSFKLVLAMDIFGC